MRVIAVVKCQSHRNLMFKKAFTRQNLNLTSLISYLEPGAFQTMQNKNCLMQYIHHMASFRNLGVCIAFQVMIWFLSKTLELNSSITCKLIHNSLFFVVLSSCQTLDLRLMGMTEKNPGICHHSESEGFVVTLVGFVLTGLSQSAGVSGDIWQPLQPAYSKTYI